MSITQDYTRYTDKKGLKGFLSAYIRTANYRVVFWFRLNKKCQRVPIFSTLITFLYWRLAFKRHVEIPKKAEIGAGLYLIHAGVVTINQNAKIGKNCTIVSSANIGLIASGKNKGTPTIGDNVYIGPNVCILGNVKVGNNVAIGANSVVTHDIADNGVAVGSPAKTINSNGSAAYIVRPIAE